MKQLYENIKNKRARKLIIQHHLIIIDRLKQLLSHGFTLGEAMSFIIKQLKIADQTLYDDVQNQLTKGANCYDVFKQLDYPRTILMQLYFAEKYGTILDTLERCHVYYSKNRKLKQKLIKTIQYPLTLLLIFLILIIVLNYTVMPQFDQMHDSMQVNVSTAQIILKQFISNFPIIFVITIITVVISVLSFRYWLAKQNINRQIYILSRIPLFNKYYKLIMTYQIANQFVLFLANGISLNDIVHIYINQNENVFFKYIGYELQKNIKQGIPFSAILSKLNCFDSNFISYIEQGEKRDKLDIELNIYCNFLIDHIESFMMKHIKWIQPVIFLLISSLILSVYLVMMLPIFEMIQTIQN